MTIYWCKAVEEVLEASRSKASGTIIMVIDADCNDDDNNDQRGSLVQAPLRQTGGYDHFSNVVGRWCGSLWLEACVMLEFDRKKSPWRIGFHKHCQRHALHMTIYQHTVLGSAVGQIQQAVERLWASGKKGGLSILPTDV